MFDVDNEGNLFYGTKDVHIFSESSEKSFGMKWHFNKDNVVMFMVWDKTPFCDVRYCALELSVKFLKDFYYTIDIGDFCFDFSNVAHHEE